MRWICRRVRGDNRLSCRRNGRWQPIFSGPPNFNRLSLDLPASGAARRQLVGQHRQCRGMAQLVEIDQTFITQHNR